MRSPWLGRLLFFAGLAALPLQAAANEDPGFCRDIREVVQASRTDFRRWQGRLRGSEPSGYETTRTLPRASACRIGRESGAIRYTCDWEYRQDEETAARTAADRFLDGILNCMGGKVERVVPSSETTTERRQTTLLVVQDDEAHSAELRVSFGYLGKILTWYVAFSANRAR